MDSFTYQILRGGSRGDLLEQISLVGMRNHHGHNFNKPFRVLITFQDANGQPTQQDFMLYIDGIKAVDRTGNVWTISGETPDGTPFEGQYNTETLAGFVNFINDN